MSNDKSKKFYLLFLRFDDSRDDGSLKVYIANEKTGYGFRITPEGVSPVMHIDQLTKRWAGSQYKVLEDENIYGLIRSFVKGLWDFKDDLQYTDEIEEKWNLCKQKYNMDLLLERLPI